MITEISKFREKYPEYSDLDDATLANKLAVKYPEYSDLPDKVRLESKPESKKPGWVEPVKVGLETAGLLGGGLLGTVAGPAGTVAGAGLGYAGARAVGRLGEELLGYEKPTAPLQTGIRTVKDIATGGAMEAGGQIVPKVIGMVGEKVLAPTLGRLTGAGTPAIKESIKGGEQFTKAMRGKITGEEIVENARGALNVMKESRASAYRTELQNLEKSGIQIDLAPIKGKTEKLLKQYTLVDQQGNVDWTRSALGSEKSEGVRKIKQIVKTINEWGEKKGDNTPLGLDTLKRQLDDFYSESSNARSFVASLRSEVKNTIVKEVPEYSRMMKGYEEATGLIKDIESNLMLRKQGISGRITADQTLRRLMSAMKDNFALRKDLLDALGTQGGEELTSQIAGYTMSEILPRGLMATLTTGGMATLTYLNPKLWPILVASSPKISGEFLNLFGKYLGATKGIAELGGKAALYGAERFEKGRRIEMEQ